MTIIIDAPAEIEAVITKKAAREGISVSEFFLRAAIERAAVNGFANTDLPANGGEDREARRKAAREMIKSGYFARTGLSTADLFAERREDLRLETEREAGREADRNASRTWTVF